MELPFEIKKFLPLVKSLAFIGLLALIISIIKNSGYHLIYSATPSMPRGVYLGVPLKKIARSDIVEFLPPPHIRGLMRTNRWGPAGGTLIKYVFALPGDHVCISQQMLWINNKKIAPVAKFYAPNKLLPQTKICGKLAQNQYLLLSTKSERSFDGRYFGLILSQAIVGQAIPLFVYADK